MEQWAQMQLHASWLTWAGAVLVAGLVTAGLVWTGWKIRGVWHGLQHQLSRRWRHGAAQANGRRSVDTKDRSSAAAPGRQVVGLAAYQRQAAGAVGTASPESEDKPGPTGSVPGAESPAAVLEELLDRLHRVAATLDALQSRRRQPAPVAHDTSGSAWDLEFVNRQP